MNQQNNDVRMLNRQVEEAETKAAKLFEEQERRKAEMKAAIEKSRQMQIQRKKMEKDMEKKEEGEFAEYWRMRNQELQDAEHAENYDEKERNRELQNFLRLQAEEKAAKAEEEFVREQKAATKAQALNDQQEKFFYNYAEEKIGTWQGTGKNVKPLVLELKGQAKALHKAG